MRVLIENDATGASRVAADIVSARLVEEPASVLGLATGSTPRELYEILGRMHAEDDLDFSRATVFAPDELVGVRRDDPASNHRALAQMLFDRVNLLAGRCHVPDGTAADPAAAIQSYARSIATAGGIDLQILGLGVDGHLAANDPGSSLASRARVVAVTPAKRPYLAAVFGGEGMIPRRAMTLGIGTLMSARRCLLLAFGDGKADAVARTVEGPVTALVPSSALQLHPDVTLLIDESAAQGLELVDHYRQARGRL